MPLATTKLIPKTKKTRKAETSAINIEIDNIEATSLKRCTRRIAANIFHLAVPDKRPQKRFKFIINPRRRSYHLGNMPEATSS